MIWGYHYFWKHPHGYFFLLILLFQQTIRWKKIRGLFPLASFRLSWLLLKTKWETANPSQPGGSDVFFSSVGSCCFHANQPGISNVWCQDSGHGASGILGEKEITTTWELYIQPAIRGLRHGSGTSFFENRYKKRRTTCDIGSDFSKSFDISHISKLYQKSHWRNQSRRRWCQNVNSQSYRHKVLPGSWYEKSPFFYLSQTNTTCINRKFQTFHPKNPLTTPGVFGSWHHLTELLLCSLGCLCKSTWCSQALQAASGTKKRLRTCVNRFPQ